MQQGLGCSYTGVEFLEGRKGVMAEKFCAFISKYYHRFWFVRLGLSKELRSGCNSNPEWRGFRSFNSMLEDKDLKNLGKYPVDDVHCLEDYHGIIVNHHLYLDSKKLKKYKGLLVLNSAFLPHFGQDYHTDKYYMSLLFDSHEKLKTRVV